ncbi:MAG: hypothetical protein ACP6KW_08095 [Candidatus Thorarchaeota archaeon]
MNIYKKVSLALFALILVGVGAPLASAQGMGLDYQFSSGIASLETDSISIKVTGNNQVPHFHWWDPNNPTVDYHVMFVKMYEANDTDDNGVYDYDTDVIVGAPFALPTTGWDFSGFEVEEVDGNATAVHFNFTTTETFDPRPSGMDFGQIPSLSPFDVYIQIRVHLDLTNPGEMKFDLIVDGWQWTYDTSFMVLHFVVNESNHGQEMGTRDVAGFHKTGTKFQFSNGYFEYNETALAAQNQVQVTASYGAGDEAQAGQSIYLAFENFGNETLVYDPVLGIESATSMTLDPMTLTIVGGLAAVVLIGAIVVKVRK